ncbi:MAG: hypothetical protein ACRCZG_01355 [Culicoidibacterales bacterium]
MKKTFDFKKFKVEMTVTRQKITVKSTLQLLAVITIVAAIIYLFTR